MSNKIKMIKKDYFSALCAFLKENPRLVFHTDKGDIPASEMKEFANREMELLAKKNSADRKPTAQQKENEALAQEILDTLAENPEMLYTVSDLLKAVPACTGLSNQKVSAIMRQLNLANRVKKVEDKRKSYFQHLD